MKRNIKIPEKSKSFEIKICSRANIRHVIVPEGIWTQKYDKPVFRQFLKPLNQNFPPTKVGSSISGNFLFMIIKGELHLFTITSNLLFADACDLETTFIDADFTYEEKYLYALTNTNKFVFFSTIPPMKLQTFSFFSEHPASSFVLNESLNCFMVYIPNNSENPYFFYRIPTTFKSPNPHKPLVLDRADDIKDEYNNLCTAEHFSQYRPNPCAFERENYTIFNTENGESVPSNVLELAEVIRENKNSLTIYQNSLRQKMYNTNLRLEQVKNKKKRLVDRFDAARDRFVEYFYRIQRLIENADSGTKVAQSARNQSKDQLFLESVTIPETELNEDVIYDYYGQQFQSRLQSIEDEIKHLLRPNNDEDDA